MTKQNSTHSEDAGPKTVAALGQRLVEIDRRRREVSAGILELENCGAIEEGEDPRRLKVDTAAIELLNSGTVWIAPDSTASLGRQLKERRQELKVIDRAVELSHLLLRKLEAKEFGERLTALKPRSLKTMRRVSLALVELERALQERDDLLRDLRPLAPCHMEGWVLTGRIHNSGSQVYRFLQTAARENWISNTEFETELKNARSK